MRGTIRRMSGRAILVTAFEPSGDQVAAPLIRELKSRDRGLDVYALGGPQMKLAGAEIIEETTGDAVMGAGALSKVFEHRARLDRLHDWMAGRRLDAVIPTDSPAANWSVCRLTRRLQPQAKIIHLVAPQLWAWASWRIRRMRQLSDHALCLLPFEPAWFRERGVPATFVGHPIFDRLRDDNLPGSATRADPQFAQWSAGTRLALLPGSRSSEVMSNLPTMLRTLGPLRDRVGRLTVVIAASDDARERLIRDMTERHPAGSGVIMHHVVGKTDEVLRWADGVMVCSGTATLQVAAHRKPMVILYNASRLMWHGLGRWIVSTRTFSLPNLIGEHIGLGRRVPEFVPHFRDPAPLIEAMGPLLSDVEERQQQRELFDEVHRQFEGVRFADAAGDAVERLLA